MTYQWWVMLGDKRVAGPFDTAVEAATARAKHEDSNEGVNLWVQRFKVSE